MSDKYCPAGKCECGRYMGSVLAGEYCSLGWEPTNRFEQCPWPSKQISLDVISKEEVDLLIDLQKSTAHAAGRLAGLQEAMEAVHADGRLAGLREAMEAVANIRLRFDSDTPGNVDLTLPEFQWVRDKAIAAIDRLMGGK